MKKSLFVVLLLCLNYLCKASVLSDSLYNLQMQRSFVEALEKDVEQNCKIQAAARIMLIEKVTLYCELDYNIMSADTINEYMKKLSRNMNNDTILLALYRNCIERGRQLELFQLTKNILLQEFDSVKVSNSSKLIKSLMNKEHLSECQNANIHLLDSLLTLFPLEVNKMIHLFDIKDDKCKNRLKIYSQMVNLDSLQLKGFAESFLYPYYEKTELSELVKSEIPFISRKSQLIQNLLLYMKQEGKEPDENGGVMGLELLKKFLSVEFELSTSHRKNN